LSELSDAFRWQLPMAKDDGAGNAWAMASPRLQRGRNSLCGHYYSITTVVTGRRMLFTRVELTEVVTLELDRVSSEGDVLTVAWVLMPDHLHWIFRLESGSLARCLQRFKSRSARAVNQCAGMSGTLWQAGYYDHQLRSDEDLLMQTRYVLANPIRKGLVARIEDYPSWWCRWISSTAELT
jgi:REP element-mobilizing transposase RayT